MVGCGSIGQTILPLLLRDHGVPAHRVTVLTADERGGDIAAGLGVRFLVAPLTPENHRAVLGALIGPGDFLLNLSVEVASLELLRFASESRRALSRHRHRAVARWLYRLPPLAGRAFQPGVSRACAGPAADHRPRPADGGHLPGRQPRPGLTAGQGRRARPRAGCWAWSPSHRRRPMAGRGCFATLASARSRSPSTTARSAARHGRPASSSAPGRSTGSSARASQPAELGWGTARGGPAGGRPPARGRGARHLSAAPRRRRARAQLGPGRRSVRRLSGHPHGIALDRRSPDSARARPRRLSPDRALRLLPVPRFTVVAARAAGAGLGAAGAAADLGQRYRARSGRARRPARRSSARRLSGSAPS